ncbi:ATP-binding protein [Nocardioides panacis]|uniref:ATP-binding protein n=1 Tax=Nocardioides panacis TaxID=2849501 RepID=A0A975Y0F3_9ACTN|nr:ATP-binding protein [Nocardioides panacis]QWZ08269.1 ATP-binding protein [Nocardioides panacis]
MAGEYALRGLAVPESLDLLQDLLELVRREHPDLHETDVSMFETAIVEIHGNVVEHGHPPGQVIYAFELEVSPDRLVGILADTGVAAPDLSGMDTLPHEMAESGRGLWLAKATLDDLQYVRIGDRNTWKLVRNRTDL